MNSRTLILMDESGQLYELSAAQLAELGGDGVEAGDVEDLEIDDFADWMD